MGKTGSSTPKNDGSLVSVLSKVADGLKDDKTLLFTFGVIVVLLLAGALAFENLRLVIAGVLLVMVIGVVMKFFDNRKTREKRGQPRKSDPAVKTEGANIIGIETGEYSETTDIDNTNPGSVQTGGLNVIGGVTGKIERKTKIVSGPNKR